MVTSEKWVSGYDGRVYHLLDWPDGDYPVIIRVSKGYPRIGWGFFRGQREEEWGRKCVQRWRQRRWWSRKRCCCICNHMPPSSILETGQLAIASTMVLWWTWSKVCRVLALWKLRYAYVLEGFVGVFFFPSFYWRCNKGEEEDMRVDEMNYFFQFWFVRVLVSLPSFLPFLLPPSLSGLLNVFFWWCRIAVHQAKLVDSHCWRGVVCWARLSGVSGVSKSASRGHITSWTGGAVFLLSLFVWLAGWRKKDLVTLFFLLFSGEFSSLCVQFSECLGFRYRHQQSSGRLFFLPCLWVVWGLKKFWSKLNSVSRMQNSAQNIEFCNNIVLSKAFT